jgi:membrane peptidoglycan carboxypeptidase
VLSPDQVAGLTDALSSVPGADGVALKTGAWNDGDGAGHTDVWSIGYTRDLAAAIWIGSPIERQLLIDKTGSFIVGAGLPTEVLQRVLTATP